MEKITFYVNFQRDKFVDYWLKWTKHITPIKPNTFWL